MKIIQKLLAAVRNWRWFGRVESVEPESRWQELRNQLVESYCKPSASHAIIERWNAMTPEQRKNESLARLARLRAGLIAKRAKLKKQKKAYLWVDKHLQALTNEELALEQGK